MRAFTQSIRSSNMRRRCAAGSFDARAARPRYVLRPAANNSSARCAGPDEHYIGALRCRGAKVTSNVSRAGRCKSPPCFRPARGYLVPGALQQVRAGSALLPNPTWTRELYVRHVHAAMVKRVNHEGYKLELERYQHTILLIDCVFANVSGPGCQRCMPDIAIGIHA